MRSSIFVTVFAITALLTSCSNTSNNPDPTVEAAQVVQDYGTIVHATYSDAVTEAEALLVAVKEFVASPTELTLQNAKSAYIKARHPFGQTDAFRFYGGPIDDENGWEGALNGWPLDESFIDYTVDNPNSGLISDTVGFPEITKETLLSKNELGGEETYLATGYHAIEFLLWGQDLYVDTPGRRAALDYVTGISGAAAANTINSRRGKYLIAVTELLVEHLISVRNEWASGSPYRVTFELATQANASLQAMLTGVGKLALGELSGERMNVALKNQDQEDEHSCFSDQTHNDIILGQRGIANVLTGTYTRINGTVITGRSFVDLVRTKDVAKADALVLAITQATSAVTEIQSPFDQEIVKADGRMRVKKAIDALINEGAVLQDAARVLGITLSL